MTRKKLGKVLLVWLCIITLLMPFASEVLAATLNSDSVTAVLESIPFREGGKESTGVDSNNYDTNSYKYSISGVNVLKVVQHDNGYNDTFYCLDAKRSLSITKNHNYKRAAKDLTQSSDSEVEKWKKSVGISEENYKALYIY